MELGLLSGLYGSQPQKIASRSMFLMLAEKILEIWKKQEKRFKKKKKKIQRIRNEMMGYVQNLDVIQVFAMYGHVLGCYVSCICFIVSAVNFIKIPVSFLLPIFSNSLIFLGGCGKLNEQLVFYSCCQLWKLTLALYSHDAAAVAAKNLELVRSQLFLSLEKDLSTSERKYLI